MSGVIAVVVNGKDYHDRKIDGATGAARAVVDVTEGGLTAAGGAWADAAAGALAGSIVPGVGNIAGAAIGFTVGVIAGFGTQAVIDKHRKQPATSEEFRQRVGEAVARTGEEALGADPELAKLLLLKRKAFEHEAEFRLLYVERRDVPVQEVVSISMEPNEIFDEVTFDPRLATFERLEREANATRLGYAGKYGRSGTYEADELIVVVPE